MADDLLDLALAGPGGRELWKTLGGLRIDISIGGPIWAMKGWPPDTTFDQVITMDTVNEYIVFSPFTRADRWMVFDAATDSVAIETLDGQPIETLAPARTLVGHYTSCYQGFDGLPVATRRRLFRRNPDNTVNLNLPSITLDIHDVELIRRNDRQVAP